MGKPVSKTLPLEPAEGGHANVERAASDPQLRGDAVEQAPQGGEVNRGQNAPSGEEVATRHAGMRDQERTTGNDRELAANNMPSPSSAEQPGKPANRGGFNQE